MRIVNLAVVSVVAVVASEASAERLNGWTGPTRQGRLELRVGGAHDLSNSASFADESPKTTVLVGAGYFIADGIAVGGAVGFGALDSDSSSYQGELNVAAFHRMPIVRAFAGARIGYYRLEVMGSDYTFDDHGPLFGVDLGFRVAIPWGGAARVIAEPAVVLSLLAAGSVHGERNSSYPDWTRAAQLGIQIPLIF